MTIILIATLLGVLASTNAMPSEKSSDIAATLHQLGLSPTKAFALEEDTFSDDDDDDDDAMDSMVAKALLSGTLGSENGEDSMIAAIMKENEEKAAAQFRFLLNIINRLENSRLGRRIIRFIRQRYCRQE